jgi:hypothetical protein
LHRRGWRADLGCPAEVRWDGQQLLLKGEAVSFIVNRSTDFFWQSEDFCALRKAYHAGRVYVAPNLSPMPRAATNGCWNGYHCRIGTKSCE